MAISPAMALRKARIRQANNFYWSQAFMKFRKDFLCSQERAADLLGVCRRTWQEIENGRTEPSNETARKFRALLEQHQEQEA